MHTPGRHHLFEFYDCDATILDDENALKKAMLEAVRLSGATVIADVFHKFSPQGVTGVIAIAESHVSIHTWPEHGYAAVDAFTCSERMRIDLFESFLKRVLGAARVDEREFARGEALHAPRALKKKRA